VSRGPGRVQRFVLAHLAALEGNGCPGPDIAVAYAVASCIPLEMRRGRRDYQRAIPYAPRPTEEAVYRACRVLADRGVITWSRNAYGLFMEPHYARFALWLHCYRDPSFPAQSWSGPTAPARAAPGCTAVCPSGEPSFLLAIASGPSPAPGHP
jgi:hypothetical protein